MSMQGELTDVAERALRAFGGDVTRPQAALLLTMWRYVRDLTPADMAAVLGRFPSADRVEAAQGGNR
ncbi:hypothetical protein GCM10009557_11580 [Virgisporangium ochraceum]|uniref:Uncharacterized protein n=1 Tax=Virgisporangium ochraceum TaxID=65505 RepID=A0A8J3ZVT7_9ACTN|nr:hypothetical protein [Virgisporangium ochraceum]GIJ69892.1 hypothetical protein Voc01_048090 [Virgisporangium ochraceum]